jgi:hypothetical protein
VALEDVNSFHAGSGRQATLYAHSGKSGRVDVVRSGNTFEARTRGVEEFRLLLSPDVLDFTQPVRVTVNGRPVFNAAVNKDVAALRRWAERDDDRKLLYAAEIRIAVP